MKLDREINTMLLTSMYVNLDVLKKQKDRLDEAGQMNLEMLVEDFDKLVEKLKEEPPEARRRRLFDELPVDVAASLPTWPLPTLAQVEFVHKRWKDSDGAD